jgi:hypothetical protein
MDSHTGGRLRDSKDFKRLVNIEGKRFKRGDKTIVKLEK